MSTLGAGLCEWHGAYSCKLMPIKIPDNNEQNVWWNDTGEKSFYTNPFYACVDCRERISSIMGIINVDISLPKKIDKSISEDFCDSRKDLIKSFMNIKDIFPGLIKDIYIIPNDEFPENSPYQSKVNILVGFRGLTLLGYTRWAAQTRKSAVHLWNDEKLREKFWSPKLLRILMALGKIQKETNNLNIWVFSYLRIVSIDTLVDTPPKMIQAFPKKLYKLTE